MKEFPELTVLVVDDVPLTIVLLQKLLSIYHCKVRTAKNVPATIASINEQKPDIILLDVMLEDYRSGLEVVKYVREDSRLKDIKIILFSAWCSSEDKEKGYSAGADDYIEKPIKKEIFYKAMDKQLAALGYSVV